MSRHDELPKPGRNDVERVAGGERLLEVNPETTLVVTGDRSEGRQGKTAAGPVMSSDVEAMFGLGYERVFSDEAAPRKLVIAQAGPAQTSTDAVPADAPGAVVDAVLPPDVGAASQRREQLPYFDAGTEVGGALGERVGCVEKENHPAPPSRFSGGERVRRAFSACSSRYIST